MRKYINLIFSILFKNVILHIINTERRIHGDSKRLHISKSAYFNNALFNTMSGSIYIDDFSFAGHNVSLLTGTHDFNKKNSERRDVIPLDGNDIRIGKGVWICSNATIIGPCTIGDNSVVAAGSVVITDIPPNVIYGGIPAKLIKNINFH